MINLNTSGSSLLTRAAIKTIITSSKTSGAVKTRVDYDVKYSAGSASALSSKAFNISTGDTIKVGVTSANNGSGYNSFAISDTQGNSYALEYMDDDGTHVEAWYVAKNCPANAANVISANTNSDNNPYIGLATVQYRGASPTAPLDGTPVGARSSTATVTSPAFSTTDVNDVILALLHSSGSGTTFTVSGGLTLIMEAGDVIAIADWQPGTLLSSATVGGGITGASYINILVQAVF